MLPNPLLDYGVFHLQAADRVKNLLFQGAALEGGSERRWFYTRSNRGVLQGLSRRRCFTEHGSSSYSGGGLLGAPIAGRSGAALALTAIYCVGCVLAIRAEEQALERVFGTKYRRYRTAVPRYMRLPPFR